MNHIKKLLKKITARHNLNKRKVLIFIATFGLVLTLSLASNIFGDVIPKTVWVITIVLYSLFITAIAVWAGLTVIKSFFLLGAEVSLMIFLAQSYCGAQTIESPSDSGLKILIFMAGIFIIFKFFNNLTDELEKKILSLRKTGLHWEEWLMIVLFAFFTIFFISVIGIVVFPIVDGLCVYNR